MRVQAFESVGPYRLIKELSVGGMGQVWLAEQTEPVHWRVALKLTRAESYGTTARQGFWIYLIQSFSAHSRNFAEHVGL